MRYESVTDAGTSLAVLDVGATDGPARVYLERGTGPARLT